MKNKSLILALIILGIVLVILVGVYFIQKNKALINPSGQDGSTTTSQTVVENQEGVGGDANKIVTDDFSIDLPDGWKQTAASMGATAMAVNSNEHISDPAAQKINFQSYFAVSYETLQGKSMNDFLQIVKNGLSQTIPNVVFTKEQNMTIDGRIAHAIEAELTQQGVDFKVLVVLVAGQGEDVWVLSFNTTKSSWDGYKETFYSIANSFSVKK